MTTQFTRVIVSFHDAVAPEGMANNRTIMLEFMECVGSCGLGRVYEEIEGAPLSWSGEVYDGFDELPSRLKEWWNKYEPNCVVHEIGDVYYPHTNDTAIKYSIEPT